MSSGLLMQRVDNRSVRCLSRDRADERRMAALTARTHFSRFNPGAAANPSPANSPAWQTSPRPPPLIIAALSVDIASVGNATRRPSLVRLRLGNRRRSSLIAATPPDAPQSPLPQTPPPPQSTRPHQIPDHRILKATQLRFERLLHRRSTAAGASASAGFSSGIRLQRRSKCRPPRLVATAAIPCGSGYTAAPRS